MTGKPILIISHERSGWHFLANSIAFNSEYSNEQIDFPLTTDKNRLESFLGHQKDNANRIYKSHHDSYALEPVWPIICQKFHVLYLVRDGRDVMTSCFHYFNKYSDRDFFRSKTVGDMMRTNPEGKGKRFHECYWSRPVENMTDRWAKHVTGYIADYHDINIIKYESLKKKFEINTRDILYEITGRLPNFYILKEPTLQDKCIFPRKGIIGDWKSHFTQKDEVFFYDQARDAMRLAGYW